MMGMLLSSPLTVLITMIGVGCGQCGQPSTPMKSHASPSPSAAIAPRTMADFDRLFALTSMTRDVKEDLAKLPDPASSRSYPGAERTALPAPQSEARITLTQAIGRMQQVTSPIAIRLQTLSDLLFYTYGETAGRGGLRAAASAGALYPADVFVSVRRANDFVRGIYYYDPERHDLVRLSMSEAVEPSSPSLLVVLGATYARSAVKYGQRALRYVPLDVGHVAANAVLVASALGLACQVNANVSDPALEARLGPAREEGILMVLACGGSEVTKSPSPLLLPALPDRDLFRTIAARRSHRRFRDQSIARGVLDGLLSTTALPVGLPLRERLIEPWVFVRRVTNLAAGLYRYDHERAELILVRAGDLTTKLAAAGLSQEQLSQAGFVIAWTMNEESNRRPLGAGDFRNACMQAGIAGELAYLVASVEDLGICGVGAFFDAELNGLFGKGQSSQTRTLYLVAVGVR
jgi:SagB-type dehydrogenase family enzyme